MLNRQIQRNLRIAERVLHGESYREIGEDTGLSHNRVSEVMEEVATLILKQCKASGHIEDFYPGPVKNRLDYDQCIRGGHRAEYNGEIIDVHGGIEVIRQYKDFWLGQIAKMKVAPEPVGLGIVTM